MTICGPQKSQPQQPRHSGPGGTPRSAYLVVHVCPPSAEFVTKRSCRPNALPLFLIPTQLKYTVPWESTIPPEVSVHPYVLDSWLTWTEVNVVPSSWDDATKNFCAML